MASGKVATLDGAGRCFPTGTAWPHPSIQTPRFSAVWLDELIFVSIGLESELAADDFAHDLI